MIKRRVIRAALARCNAAGRSQARRTHSAPPDRKQAVKRRHRGSLDSRGRERHAAGRIIRKPGLYDTPGEKQLSYPPGQKGTEKICWRWCINQIGPVPGFFDLLRPATASEAGLFAAPRPDLAGPTPLSATPGGACLPYTGRATGGYAAGAGISYPEPGRIAGGCHWAGRPISGRFCQRGPISCRAHKSGQGWTCHGWRVYAGPICPSWARTGRREAAPICPERSRLDAIRPGRVAPFPHAWGHSGQRMAAQRGAGPDRPISENAI